MNQATQSANTRRSSIQFWFVTIGLICSLNGMLANWIFWWQHHEGIFWSLSYQRFNLIYGLISSIANGFFCCNLLLVQFLSKKFYINRLFALLWLVGAALINDWFFGAALGADFAQVYLSRLPVCSLLVIWLIHDPKACAKPRV